MMTSIPSSQTANASSASRSSSNHKEIYTYQASFPLYSHHWSQRPNSFTLGCTSFMENYQNKLQILSLFHKGGDLVKLAEADHSYPITKFMWSPYQSGLSPDLFATTGDYMRIWELVTPDEAMSSEYLEGEPSSDVHVARQVICRGTLANIRRVGHSKKEFCAPLTSFDWNETDPSLCVTSSIDTTCTVWDINTQQAKTQLIAHDKEVYDVAFSKGTNIFASVGADGSLRMFDLRSLEHSTIIYETPPATGSNKSNDPPGLLRLAWNKQDPSYLATFQHNSKTVLILDIRVPAVPVVELHTHTAPINSIAWAPHSSGHIVTVGDDAQAFVWDISHMTKAKHLRDPILAYSAESEINHVSWSASSPDWVAISFGDKLQALKI